MTNPTADAAKSEGRRAQWTLTSGDEIFLVGEDGVGLRAAGHVIVKPLREWHALANTRPQPAPPAGEPDQIRRALSIAKACLEPYKVDSEWCLHNPGHASYNLCELAKACISLGLASRPKVEDAEVKDAVKWLREFAKNWADGVAGAVRQDHPAWDMADILERLAEEVGQYKRAECCHFENVAELQSALAEREAELAKARELIYANVDPMDMHPKYRETYDAARQQQKASAEQTAREDEQHEREDSSRAPGG